MLSIPNPLVALVGRPNVGKSTLFNRLVGERRAVVHERPGTTRDRLYATVDWSGRTFVVVDTGGIGASEGSYEHDVRAQAEVALREADVVVMVVDAQGGITSDDLELGNMLRRSAKPLVLAASKADNRQLALQSAEFYQLGLGEPIPISGSHGTGTGDLLDAIVERLPTEAPSLDEDVAVSIAIVGRPNSGKSSLVNALLGQERLIVSPRPGTTRDAVDTLLEYDGTRIALIDTAGIRRSGRIVPGVERYSVLRSLRAIERADVAVVLLDATQGVANQDAHVAGFVHERRKGILLAVNKWDLVEKGPREADAFTERLRRELIFLSYAPVIFISALTRLRVRRVLDMALQIKGERKKRIATSELNAFLHETVVAQPHTAQGKRLKLFYATQAELEPPTFVLFVNNPALVHFSYERFLENRLRERFGFEGTGLRLVFRGRQEA